MITVTSETAKLLKEAGWKKETHFIWVESFVKGISKVMYSENPLMWRKILNKRIIYAPTLQEILEELPDNIDIHKYSHGYSAITTEIEIFKESLTEAAALLWIELNKK